MVDVTYKTLEEYIRLLEKQDPSINLLPYYKIASKLCDNVSKHVEYFHIEDAQTMLMVLKIIICRYIREIFITMIYVHKHCNEIFEIQEESDKVFAFNKSSFLHNIQRYIKFQNIRTAKVCLVDMKSMTPCSTIVYLIVLDSIKALSVMNPVSSNNIKSQEKLDDSVNISIMEIVDRHVSKNPEF